MVDKRQLTDEQLLEAPMSSLTTEELTRRSAIVNIQKLERESEMIAYQNEDFRTKKDERARMRKIGRENAAAQKAKERAEQAACLHKTGGEGLRGWLKGDGAIYGSSTAILQLPTQETYVLCARCSKEWHDPENDFSMRDTGEIHSSMYDVMQGVITLTEWRQRKRDYVEAMNWPRKSFEPWNGEFCAASQFNIPALNQRRNDERREFANWIAKKEHVGEAVAV